MYSLEVKWLKVCPTFIFILDTCICLASCVFYVLLKTASKRKASRANTQPQPHTREPRQQDVAAINEGFVGHNFVDRG